MSRSGAAIYNAISFLFLLLTVGMVIFVVVMLATQEPEPEATVALPTRFISPTPSDTLSPTPSETPIPSLTPTNTPTLTLTLTPTIAPSDTPSVTPTQSITPTPSITFTPSVSPTPTVTASPTPTPTPTGPSPTPLPTLSPFLFDQRGEVEFRPNTANISGCAWQSVAGFVLGLNGGSTPERYRIHVYNQASTFSIRVETGSNSFYDPTSGWEVKVSDFITSESYLVQLESLGGTPISAPVSVTFPQDCNANVAVVRFIQTRERG